MTINVQIHDRSACIALSGRFVFEVHRDFKDAYLPLLNNDALREIEIEMGKLEYLDSSALGMLMLLYERSKDAGKSVSLANVSGYVAEVLETANFHIIFDIKN